MNQGCRAAAIAAADREQLQQHAGSRGLRVRACRGEPAHHHGVRQRSRVPVLLAQRGTMDGMQRTVRAAFRRRPSACRAALRPLPCIPMQRLG